MLKQYTLTILISFSFIFTVQGSYLNPFKKPTGRISKIRQNILEQQSKENRIRIQAEYLEAEGHIRKGRKCFSGQKKDPYFARRHFNYVLEKYPFKSLHASAHLNLALMDIAKPYIGRAWHHLATVINNKNASKEDKKQATRIFNKLKQPTENYFAYQNYLSYQN